MLSSQDLGPFVNELYGPMDGHREGEDFIKEKIPPCRLKDNAGPHLDQDYLTKCTSHSLNLNITSGLQRWTGPHCSSFRCGSPE